MDPLDSVFAAMRLESALYSRLHPRAPWGVKFIKSHSLRFGFVMAGESWLTVEGSSEPLLLRTGEGFIVQPQTLFALSDHPDSPTRWCEDVFKDCAGQEAQFGGSGAVSDILCGYFTFDAAGAEPLLALLSRATIIPADVERSPLLAATLQLLVLETTQDNPGARIVISRLADVLFMQAIRAHLAQQQGQQGWLAAMADARLGPLIRHMHSDLSYPWTVAELARRAGMSRSAFAAYFHRRTRETPLGYLTRWRIYRARCLLHYPHLTLDAIACKVGYDSAITLGRAFKRLEGISPDNWRRENVR
ncbi:AraC family transcriptional regulator [Candidatus Pantoea multigeneris]|uniref:AraC family transcriptional regulator n=1 Tax=Candidatus Pantoea multigeneris TaxID=2608357 RepID=A0ABX0RM34_9GAMM|nr:AraC family transcriptional regulator [Pantoea multigeneris]NIF24449.1 AraC family transcriptional regulator [Pantoea multigeneris]